MDAITCTLNKRHLTFLSMRVHQRPRPLDQTRLQSLSGPYDLDQSQSPFFKLPIELRRAIYAEAGLVSNTEIHCFTNIVHDYNRSLGGRVFGKRCTLPQDGSIVYTDKNAHKYCRACMAKSHMAVDRFPEIFTESHLEGTSLSVVPLLQTCRRLYAEAIPILYAENTFSFTDAWTLLDFLLTIPRSHAAQLHSLDLTWHLYGAYPPRVCRGIPTPHDPETWAAIWSRVGSDLSALRRLRLQLCDVVHGRCRTSAHWSSPTPRLRIWEFDVAARYDEDPKKLWLEWLEPVGRALEGKRVEVQGGIWCRMEEPGSLHAVMKGGGEEGRRVLVLAQGGEEVEW